MRFSEAARSFFALLGMFGWILVACSADLPASPLQTTLPSYSKVALTNDEIAQIYLDAMAYWIRAVDTYWQWDPEPHRRNPAGIYSYKPGQRHYGPSLKRQRIHILRAMYLLALDGTDRQVALSGLAREQLFRRSKDAKDRWVRAFRKSFELGQWEGVSSKPCRAEPIELSPREGEASINLRFYDGMDYRKLNTWRRLMANVMVPQDFADPRLLGGYSIKQWTATGAQLRGGREGNNLAPYSPEFSADHHRIVNPLYADRPFVFGLVEEAIMARLKGHCLPEMITSDRFHGWNIAGWGLNLTDGTGRLYSPQGQSRGLVMWPQTFAYRATVMNNQDPIALAFAGRVAELNRITQSWPFKKRVGKWFYTRAGMDYPPDLWRAYLMHKLYPWLTGSTAKILSYNKAARRLDGTYHYRSHRFAVHRTPDKLVTLSWNHGARADGMKKWGAEYEYKGKPFEELLQLPRENQRGGLLDKGPMGYRYDRWNIHRRAILVIPDNEEIRPHQDDPYFIGDFGAGFGAVFKGNTLAATYPLDIDEELDRTDAVLSATGRLRAWDPKTKEDVAIQYQSFTSLYDKTALSLVRVLSTGKSEWDNQASWRWGNSVTIFANPKLGFPRLLKHAKGALDLKGIVRTHVEGNDLDGYWIKKTASGPEINSAWWSVNDRIGVATTGGRGNFHTMLGIKLVTEGSFRFPSVTIGWEEPFARRNPEEGHLLVDMAAAYFTDTPADKMGELQKSLRPLDSQLPKGWKGLVTDTPDGQKALALTHFYGPAETAKVKLSFPEGAPVFEANTQVKNGHGSAEFELDKLHTLGQGLAFYVSGGVHRARQIGHTMVELQGSGQAVLRYLSRAEENEVIVNGRRRKASRQELQEGLVIELGGSSGAIVEVEVANAVDGDHTGPAVEVTQPVYLQGDKAKVQIVGGWEPRPLSVGEDGLTVRVMAKDRSGVEWVDLYLDWEKVSRSTEPPYEFRIPQKEVSPGAHALYAIAQDRLGNKNKSFEVPFKVTEREE
jgi:hypothetical protein